MEETIARIKEQRPKYVFLTSKSGAGKTYFSNQLDGYKVLELDRMVRTWAKDIGMEEPAAFQVYKNTLPELIMTAFVEKIHKFFQVNDNSSIVVEGAITDANLVKKIFSGAYADFTFVFLYPVDVDAYVFRLMKRFKEDKEKNCRYSHRLAIWPHVTNDIKEAAYDSPELKQFMQRMAHWSMDKAVERYLHFKRNGLDMIRVDV